MALLVFPTPTEFRYMYVGLFRSQSFLLLESSTSRITFMCRGCQRSGDGEDTCTEFCYNRVHTAFE